VTSNPNRHWLSIADAAKQTSCLPYTPSVLEERKRNSLRRCGLHQQAFSAYFRCIGHWSGFFARQANRFTAVGSL
jgi:hypothetical protein